MTMIELNKIYNEDCFETMQKTCINKTSVDLVLTSPPYNTNKKAGRSTTLNSLRKNVSTYIRYDMHVDNQTNEEYCEFTTKLFKSYDKILNKNGCVLYNLSYGSENTTGMFMAVSEIIKNTDFTIADVLIWKKKSAFPNNCSPNKLTRITEFVFVLCRKSEFNTFNCNKRVVSTRKTGQKMYENIFNFIEAENNDGACDLNKATFSTDFAKQVLSIYAKQGNVVYDSFTGTGTTALACAELGLNYIGSELSNAQCDYARNRLATAQRISEQRLEDFMAQPKLEEVVVSNYEQLSL